MGTFISDLIRPIYCSVLCWKPVSSDLSNLSYNVFLYVNTHIMETLKLQDNAYLFQIDMHESTLPEAQ